MAQPNSNTLVNAPGLVSPQQSQAYLVIDRSYPPILRSQFTRDGGRDRIEFTYLPNEITETGANPEWGEISVIGRFSPYSVYAGTSSGELSLSLSFFAHSDCIADVKQKVDFLRSMKYPVVHENISYRPPALLFVWGQFLMRKVIVLQADTTYSAPWFVNTDPNGFFPSLPLYPMQAAVSLALRIVEEDVINGPDVMRGLY